MGEHGSSVNSASPQLYALTIFVALAVRHDGC